MKIQEITIHNVRSVKHTTFQLSEYSMLVGENNVGKTNIFTALRLFYEDNLKYKKDIDFPKFPTDEESWVELAFETTEDEQESLKVEYRSPDKILKVRKYFESKDRSLVKANQSNIYAYESGVLSKNLFYGTRNVSKEKFGNLIHIPAVNKSDEAVKLSGPSPFRQMLNLVMKRAVLESPTFESLSSAFDKFNSNFRREASQDGYSISSLVNDINSEIDGWGTRFDISINPIRPEEIVKNLLSHYIEDVNLGGKQVNLASFGQGFQRHLIFSLIKLSARYTAPRATKKKRFDPDFTLLLFEEPEAFLHPSQQEVLCLSLRTLGAGESEQVLASTHSPHFVSKQMSQMSGIIRLSKSGTGVTETFQIKKDDLCRILDTNTGLYKEFSECLGSDGISKNTKKTIKERQLGEESPNPAGRLEDEALKYFLWLDSERASLFFARKVIICEGASEKIFIGYLFDEKWREFREKHVYLLDAQGKFNIHRYMTLLTALGIEHSVLFDSDQDKGIHGIVNSFIEGQRTRFTRAIRSFEDDFEGFLGIEKPDRKDLKPLNVMFRYHKNEISNEKLDELKAMLEGM